MKVKRAFLFLARTVKWLFIAVLVFIVSLFFREQRLPRSWTDGICDAYSSSNMVLRCERASFGFCRGLRISGVKVYDAEGGGSLEPFVTARSIRFNLFSWTVFITGLRYPRLPESYYDDGPSVERNSRVELDLPKLPEFRVVLDDPEILGLEPQRVTAHVNVRRKWVMVDDINVYLPYGARQLSVDGALRLDLVSQTLHADLRGVAMPEQIRPLIAALDLQSALPYLDAFTEIPEPVPARGDFDVNLVNGDFKMVLELKPTMGCYNGVPLARAEGVLDVYAYTRGTNCNVNLKVGLPLVLDRDGARLSGELSLKLTNDVARLAFDLRSELALADVLGMADFIDPGSLSMLKCETKPVVTLRGVCGTSLADSAYNDMAFSAYLEKGSFMGLGLEKASAQFRLRGEGIEFSSVEAGGQTGGRYSATARLDFPGYDEKKLSFAVKASVEDGALKDFIDMADIDADGRDGSVDGWLELSGPAGTDDATEHLSGRGSLKISNGHIAQLSLFAGLTKMLADYVPGVGYLVNQSDGSVDFTITDGLFSTDNLFIEGGLVSLKGSGSYSIPKDALDFVIRVQFLKKDSFAGAVVHPLMWPFTKLFLEFKANGSARNPVWDYISIVDRVL